MENSKPLYEALALNVQAFQNCIELNNVEWKGKHKARILKLVAECMPRGSGIDNGTKIDLERSIANKLVFYTSFHHMDENGFYDGWTDHEVIVTPSLTNRIELRITGRNRNEVKDYLHETFYFTLIDIQVNPYE